jgi:hypothetical protein
MVDINLTIFHLHVINERVRIKYRQLYDTFLITEDQVLKDK